MTNETSARGAMSVLLLIAFFDMLALGIIIPFMPFWAERFGASPALVAILFATFSLFALLSSFPWGVLSDRWARKPIICLGVAGSAISFAWISQADTLWELFAARALGGLMGGTLPVAHAYIADVTPIRDRAARMGQMGAAVGAGFVLGPAVGWWLTGFGAGDADFRTAFMVAAGVGFAGCVAGLSLLREPPRREPTNMPRSMPDRVRAISAAAKMPGILYPLAVLTMFAFCMGGLESTFAMWTERQLEWNVRENAIFFFYIGIILIVVQGGLVRPLVRRVGEAPLAAAGAFLMCAGFAMVVVVYAAPMAFVGGALIATGLGLGQPALIAMISRAAPAEQQGAAMGASQSVQSLCRILGPTAAGLAFSGFGRDAPYLGGAVILFFAFIVALRAARRP